MPREDSPATVSKSALHFFSGTFLSRLGGLFRDITMAFCFGANASIAAFMVAYRFANLMRRLFGESAMPTGFVPHFESLRLSSPKKGAEFFRDVFFSLTAVLLVLLAVVEGGLYAWLQVKTLSPGGEEIVRLTMLMLPGILFICLYGICSALLQCEKQFFLPAASPLAFNLIWIAAAWILKDYPIEQAVSILSLCIIAAFFAQWALLIRPLIRFLKQFLSWKELLQAHLFSIDVRHIVAPFLLSIIGIGAVQINSAIDGLFARFACEEGPAYLWYSIRIYQVPLALFGIALSSALLPPLSRAIKEEDTHQFLNLLHFSLQRCFSFIFPCTVGFFVVGAAGLNLLYGRGDFDSQVTLQTLLCLWTYGIGLLPAVFVILLAPAFYAKKDYRTPTKAAIGSVVLNILLNILMVFVLKWGTFSIALATSIASLFNCVYLSRALSVQVRPIFSWQLWSSFSKTIICTLVAGGTSLLIGHFILQDPTIPILLGQKEIVFSRSFLEQFLKFFILFGLFSIVFFSYAWMLQAEDILALLPLKKKKLS